MLNLWQKKDSTFFSPSEGNDLCLEIKCHTLKSVKYVCELMHMTKALFAAAILLPEVLFSL